MNIGEVGDLLDLYIDGRLVRGVNLLRKWQDSRKVVTVLVEPKYWPFGEVPNKSQVLTCSTKFIVRRRSRGAQPELGHLSGKTIDSATDRQGKSPRGVPLGDVPVESSGLASDPNDRTVGENPTRTDLDLSSTDHSDANTVGTGTRK